MSETVQDRRKVNLVLITNRKSYMSLRLAAKSVTLNDLERLNYPFCVISPNSAAYGAHCVKMVEDIQPRPTLTFQNLIASSPVVKCMTDEL